MFFYWMELAHYLVGFNHFPLPNGVLMFKDNHLQFPQYIVAHITSNAEFQFGFHHLCTVNVLIEIFHFQLLRLLLYGCSTK